MVTHCLKGGEYVMAAGLKNSVQVTAYVAPEIKERMDAIAKRNRRDSVSAQVEEALTFWLDNRAEEPNFHKPTQNPRSRHKTV